MFYKEKNKTATKLKRIAPEVKKCQHYEHQLRHNLQQ
jgi:hypothetical protein